MCAVHTAEPRVTKVSFGRFYCQNQAHKVILSLPSTPIVARIRPTGSYSDLLVTQQQPELGPQSHTRFSQHPFLPSFLIFLKKGACGTTEINFQCHVYQKATTLSKYLVCPRVLFSKFLKRDQVPQCALEKRASISWFPDVSNRVIVFLELQQGSMRAGASRTVTVL